MRIFYPFLFALFLIFLMETPVAARSAFSPRHSGMDAPGEGRQLQNMPSRQLSRTNEGGMGYTDAYGRTVGSDDRPGRRGLRERPAPSEGRTPQQSAAPLPDPDLSSPPLWKFQ